MTLFQIVRISKHITALCLRQHIFGLININITLISEAHSFIEPSFLKILVVLIIKAYQRTSSGAEQHGQSNSRAETSRPRQHEESKKTNKYAFCKPNVGLPYSYGGI